MEVYLGAVDEGVRPAAILGRLENEPLVVAKPLPPYKSLQSMSLPWDGDSVVTSVLRRLNGSGDLLSPPLLVEALHSRLDAGTGGNNVVVRPALHLCQVFM
ncbi:unnamed protein product [Schistocephalus solidus]|uniref:Uncharacterized protein n=1 Tax=Schistocephalus solidus TaxID=70667 RepID=A0A183TS90_SCHSO|nr:unnamed protein product [Schistocephalus solidus]